MAWQGAGGALQVPLWGGGKGEGGNYLRNEAKNWWLWLEGSSNCLCSLYDIE